MKYSFLSRSRILFFCFSIFALILIGKLFLVQVVHSNSYSEKADRQYATPSSNIFERGTIYFSNKDGRLVSAAAQTTGFKVAINPNKILNKEEVYKNLVSVLENLKYDYFFNKAKKENDNYEEIANKISKEQADAVSLLKIPNVSIFKEKWRFYPGANMASQTLGFVAYKGDELGGRYGLERQYNHLLSRNKDNPYVNFFAEVFTNIDEAFFNDEQKEGDLVTTIEPSVQNFLEKTLNDVKSKHEVDLIGGIIINPEDGSIYALSSKPDFNPNNFFEVKNQEIYLNPLVERVYEFGSVVKPLVMAAGLDKGVVTSETSYNDTGSVVVEDRTISNFDKKGRGPGTSMQDVLNQSLNTGMVFVEKRLGKQNFRDYMVSFGTKDKTGIDLPGEVSSLMNNFLNSPREIEAANAAFGQGIALTPIGITRSLVSLANGGNLVIPHIVEKIKYNDGTEKEMVYEKKRTMISEKTANEITRMLVTVMDKGIKNGLEHYSIAAKTGTAQVANSEGGGYYVDRHTHSFFGYFPAYNPKFLVFLFAVNPKGTRYAVETWSDPFLSIAKFLINYYEIPPDR